MSEPNDEWDGLIFLEPREDLDRAILGVGERGSETVLVYSRSRLLKGLMRSGMDEEEAIDWYGFNTIWPQQSGWPIFLMDDVEFDASTVESG